MTQRPRTAPSGSSYDEMPFSVVLFRYLWPFWLFKDATRGDRLARAAAYRHNRSMRIYLPGYMRRWVFNSAFALALVRAAGNFSSRPFSWDLSVLLTVASTIALAGSLCVLLVIGYIYLYLERHPG
ncbi:MAG: hypothetical protein C0P74_013060 [Gammaproteobacteria bacterium]|nr:hypothetical protein [Gammaproteobacteria bacterium]